jgi:hypothetical protein
VFGLGRFRRRRPLPRGAALPVRRTSLAPPPPPPPAQRHSRIRLIMADGSERALPDDPELSKRADYLVNAILKPPPPA